MTSPFLQIPETYWVASNDLAFAIFDKYPVNDGHILVIPKRLTPTWFEATGEEQLAIMNLVEDAKTILDERYRPDGYNIGINVGAAADPRRNPSHCPKHVGRPSLPSSH